MEEERSRLARDLKRLDVEVASLRQSESAAVARTEI